MSGSDSAIRVAVLTVSDSTADGTRQDLSGPALSARCVELGWHVVAASVVPDDPKSIAEKLQHWIMDGFATLILTTGGTGITTRDITPEATRSVIQKELPGVAELIRQRGLEQTPFSVLSRAIVGTCDHTLIVNLPGSPTGAAFSLAAIDHLIPHIVKLLDGHTEHSTSDTGNSLA